MMLSTTQIVDLSKEKSSRSGGKRWPSGHGISDELILYFSVFKFTFDKIFINRITCIYRPDFRYSDFHVQ